jgi:hypothetical protein
MISPAAKPGAPATPSWLRVHLRAARHGLLPVLGIAIAVFVAGYARPAFGALLPLAPGWWGVSQVAVWSIILSLPFLLFAASGLRPSGVMRALVAACFALYAAAIVRPVTMLAFGVADLVQQEWLGDDLDAELRYSLAYVRLHPHAEAEAKRAVAWGDERYYAINGFGLYPPGIRWPIDGWKKYGMKEMPGFSDGGSPDIRAAREVICWVFRYDTAMVHLRPAPGVKPADAIRPREHDGPLARCDSVPAER